MSQFAKDVLIVDDEEAICWGLEKLLTQGGHRVSVAATAEDAIDAALQHMPDLVVMDVRLPGMDGLSAMKRLGSLVGPVPVVIITAFGSLETAVAAMNGGAADYLVKPFDLEQAAAVVRRVLGNADKTIEQLSPATVLESADELLGSSGAMQIVFKQIALVAPTDVPVFITGESGTGKELVARAIHRHSRRAVAPLVPVNLASLSPTLVESELFGHVRGAFTGAERGRAGLLELADGGTVLLDETADIPPSVQVKLLRVLEQREVTAVGDTHSRHSDFRLIAATNRDVQRCLRDGTLRQDLYYRLAGFEISLPPLRERPQDIPILAERFLTTMRLPQPSSTAISPAALAELCRRPWPGNVRELRSAVEHGALMARGGPIEVEHLPPARELDQPAADATAALRQAVRQWTAERLASADAQGKLYEQFLAVAEPQIFAAVLHSTMQNRAAAADLLGIHRATLRKKL